LKNKEKSVESFFEICIIRERKVVFQSSHIKNNKKGRYLMPLRVKEIEGEALQLSPHERAQLLTFA
jgi:hypothetical protein